MHSVSRQRSGTTAPTSRILTEYVRLLTFLKVPEPKVVKNRVHLDVQAGGGGVGIVVIATIVAPDPGSGRNY